MRIPSGPSDESANATDRRPRRADSFDACRLTRYDPRVSPPPTPTKTHFIILIGGPGLFDGKDKAHDQTWLNYVVPMQLAASKNLYQKAAHETVHWVVYEPAYQARWKDDSVITPAEKREDDGYNLHSIRKQAADAVLTRGATSYLGRIQAIARKYSITYKGISKPSEFWKYLQAQPDGSISRVWYSGHASASGLSLSLRHNAAGVALLDAIVGKKEIKTYAGLKSKFARGSSSESNFYGCYTNGFAKDWHDTYGVRSAGAVSKIDFDLNKPSPISNVLRRIETTSTSVGAPGWTEHR